LDKNKLVEIIIEQLIKFDIKNIYSYAGDTTLRFFSALKDSPIKLYTVKHESAAGFMASAEAKLNGRLAVCVSHSGPGTANIINGIADAYSDRAPVLLISGQVPTYNIGTDYKQYLDLQKLSDPLTVYSSIVLNPASIVDQLYKAMTMAISCGGVSHLVIPMDMWEQESTAVPREYPEHLNFKPIPDQETINKSAEIINKSGKICIIYGRGVENTRDELIKLSLH
jgi:pyruvate oxidase